MKKTQGYKDKRLRKNLIGLRKITVFSLPALLAILLLPGTYAALVCFFWLSGLFSLALVLAGMNQNPAHGVVSASYLQGSHRKGAADKF
ncbi:MAG: hypothetical protein P8X63_14445 [Desulfuromonadaceae bacterium]